MRAIALVLLLFSGCYAGRFVVPRTPEGMACYRECMAIFNQCRGVAMRQAVEEYGCLGQREDCLSTCPGARWVDPPPMKPLPQPLVPEIPDTGALW